MKNVIIYKILLFSILFSSCYSKTINTNKSYTKHRVPVIFIDPGHGGDNFGTYSFDKRYKEKDFTLTTAIMVKRYLKKIGYNKVFMSRLKDEAVSLQERVSMANKLKATIFVSIHFNSAPNKKARGIEIFCFDNKKRERYNKSYVLASKILTNAIKVTKAKSRGVKFGNFFVLRETPMVAVLFEGGFMSNVNDMKNLQNISYINKIAWGIAQGIHEYLR